MPAGAIFFYPKIHNLSRSCILNKNESWADLRPIAHHVNHMLLKLASRVLLLITAGLFLLVQGKSAMTDYIRVKIKDRDQFKRVFPLPADGQEDVPDVAKFILSIIGQTIQVKKLRSSTGSFYYVSDIDHRWVIMPNWIDWFETGEMIPNHLYDAPGNTVLIDDIVVVAK